MIVDDILTSVKRTFGDESGVQVTDTDIFRWINQGMRQIVMQNESLLLVEQTANAVAGQQRYTLPSDLLILRGIRYKDENSGQYFTLKGYDLPKFNEVVDGWDGSTDAPGVPSLYSVVDSVTNTIAVYPIPQTSLSAAFKIHYNRAPVEVEFSSDTPELPVIYHEVLLKHCMLQAYEMDEDWDAAGNKATEMDRDLNLLRGREEWKSQETYPTITVMSDDQW